MNTQTKTLIKSGLFSGLIYAGLMAGFDYSDGQEFKILKFLFNGLFFGLFMALTNRYNTKKKTENKDNKTQV